MGKMQIKDMDKENEGVELQNLEIQNIDKIVHKKKKKMDPKKKKIIRRSIIAGILVIVIGFFVVSNAMSKNAGAMVMTMPITKGDIASTLDTSGTVKSELSKSYFALAVTNIGTVDVQLGDVVKKGQKLATYDIEDLEFSTKKEIVQAEASGYEYKGIASESAQAQQELAQAVTEIQNYQVLMANQDTYIKLLEDSINDEIVKKRTTLQSQNYSLQRTNNNYSFELNKPDLGTDTRENLQKEMLNNNNEMARISNELSGLSDYKTKDGREDILLQAKKDASDLKIAYEEARGKQSKAEAGILNGSSLKAQELTSEATQAVGAKAQRTLEICKEGINAEYDGIVTSVDVVAGTPVIVGGKILTVDSSEEVKVEFSVSKYDLETLAIGQKATLTISGQEYEGTVSKVNQVAIPNASGTPMVTAEVHIENPDEHIYLGIEGKIKVHTADRKDVLLAPIESINADNGGDFCYVIENGLVARRAVKIGIASDMMIEIVEGLQEGEEIIASLPAGLDVGSKVTVMPQPKAEPAGESATEPSTAPAE